MTSFVDLQTAADRVAGLLGRKSGHGFFSYGERPKLPKAGA